MGMFADHLAAAQQPRGLQPVHLRHHHVHENKIKRLGVEHFERLAAVAREIRLITELLQDAHGDLLVDGVVIHEQNSQRQFGRERDLGPGRFWRARREARV